MSVLILADHQDERLDEATAKAVSAARQIGGDVHVLVAGQNCRPAAEAAARIEGVAKVLIADEARLANRLAEPVAALLVQLAAGPGPSSATHSFSRSPSRRAPTTTAPTATAPTRTPSPRRRRSSPPPRSG